MHRADNRWKPAKLPAKLLVGGRRCKRREEWWSEAMGEKERVEKKGDDWMIYRANKKKVNGRGTEKKEERQKE